MVYCRLKSKNDNVAIYGIGGFYDDVSGILRLDRKAKQYEIIKQPKTQKVYEQFVDRMLRRYQEQFEKGVIPEKMSYEI